MVCRNEPPEVCHQRRPANPKQGRPEARAAGRGNGGDPPRERGKLRHLMRRRLAQAGSPGERVKLAEAVWKPGFRASPWIRSLAETPVWRSGQRPSRRGRSPARGLPKHPIGKPRSIGPQRSARPNCPGPPRQGPRPGSTPGAPAGLRNLRGRHGRRQEPALAHRWRDPVSPARPPPLPRSRSRARGLRAIAPGTQPSPPGPSPRGGAKTPPRQKSGSARPLRAARAQSNRSISSLISSISAMRWRAGSPARPI